MSWHNFRTHLRTINKHKLLVTKLCFKAGLYKQGLLHDLSKYSFIELKTGWKYADGKRSPIDNEKTATGRSDSWLHHFHHNKHHYEYWYNPNAKKCATMPNCYIYESALDRVAAAMVYQGDKYTDSSAYDYFIQSNIDPVEMGEINRDKLTYVLHTVKILGLEKTLDWIKMGIFEEMFNKMYI